ncbi:MAG: hypothetical protein ACO1TH_02955 [Luteitalea sp.]
MSMAWVKATVAASIGMVGVSSVVALWQTADSAVLALMLLLVSVVAASLVRFFAWRAMSLVDPTAGTFLPAPAGDSSDDLDDVLAQSFPASDPPSSSSGIARV